MAINKILATICPKRIIAVKLENRLFKNINPRDYLTKLCGFNILSSMSLSDIAASNHNQLAALNNMGPERASKAIAASRLFLEGVDIEETAFDAITSKMSVLMLHSHDGALYKDLCAVADLAGDIATKLGLSLERINDLVIAGLYHDLGKAAGKDADRHVEIASTKIHDEYKRMTIEEATTRLFAKRDRLTHKNETVGDFVNRTFKDKAEREAIFDALLHGIRVTKEDEMRTFFNLHTYFGADFLEGTASYTVLRLVALHHILELVNALDHKMMWATYAIDGYHDYDKRASVRLAIESAKDMGFWEDLVILIVADKLDAYKRRTDMSLAQASENLRAYVRKDDNKVLTEEEKKDFYRVLDKIV